MIDDIFGAVYYRDSKAGVATSEFRPRGKEYYE
jgi:hypothetical protein